MVVLFRYNRLFHFVDILLKPVQRMQRNTLVLHVSIFGPRCGKICLWAYADSQGPDQPVHTCSLIRAVTVWR